MNIADSFVTNAARFVEIRRDIHAHPELGFEEHRTSDKVAKLLAEWGIEVHRGIAGTGLVGVLRKGTGSRTIGLRADMDALPLHEANEFAHKSTTPAACTPAATTATPPCCWPPPGTCRNKGPTTSTAR